MRIGVHCHIKVMGKGGEKSLPFLSVKKKKISKKSESLAEDHRSPFCDISLCIYMYFCVCVGVIIRIAIRMYFGTVYSNTNLAQSNLVTTSFIV